MKLLDEDVLEYHAVAPAGKIAIRATKPCLTQRDLSLAYTPGVAVPCLAIERDPLLAYQYTGKGNLVAVVALLRGVPGKILQKEGKKRKFRFLFKNPLMQPLILMKGLSEGRIDKQTLQQEH